MLSCLQSLELLSFPLHALIPFLVSVSHSHLVKWYPPPFVAHLFLFSFHPHLNSTPYWFDHLCLCFILLHFTLHQNFAYPFPLDPGVSPDCLHRSFIGFLLFLVPSLQIYHLIPPICDHLFSVSHQSPSGSNLIAKSAHCSTNLRSFIRPS